MIFLPPIHGLAHIPILQFDYPNLAPHFRALPMSRCGGRSPPTPIHNPACPGRRECDRETDYVLLLLVHHATIDRFRFSLSLSLSWENLRLLSKHTPATAAHSFPPPSLFRGSKMLRVQSLFVDGDAFETTRWMHWAITP